MDDCTFCPTVKTIAFWGNRPERPWKRPALMVLSLLMLLASTLPVWVHSPLNLGAYLFFLGFFLASVLGVAVAAIGCDGCVARLMNNIGG